MPIISPSAIIRREHWVQRIFHSHNNLDFSSVSKQLEQELLKETQAEGWHTLLDHLRLSGDIPEFYGHDTSEEKQYSKYTDALLSTVFKNIGLKSLVLTERADAADIEVFAQHYSFVADAKAFRLSRTAKNQKDFKIQAMNGWKYGKPYAMVVCPIYQLPTRNSQIYQQASTQDVCIFTYSHLAVLLQYALLDSLEHAEELLHHILKVTASLNPSKDASQYWLSINKTMLGFSPKIDSLWQQEKQAAIESIRIAKEAASAFLASEREKIMRMSHDMAIQELLHVHKIENRLKTINAVCNNDLLNLR